MPVICLNINSNSFNNTTIWSAIVLNFTSNQTNVFEKLYLPIGNAKLCH